MSVLLFERRGSVLILLRSDISVFVSMYFYQEGDWVHTTDVLSDWFYGATAMYSCRDECLLDAIAVCCVFSRIQRLGRQSWNRG